MSLSQDPSRNGDLQKYSAFGGHGCASRAEDPSAGS
jgi:hypothetical protein